MGRRILYDVFLCDWRCIGIDGKAKSLPPAPFDFPVAPFDIPFCHWDKDPPDKKPNECHGQYLIAKYPIKIFGKGIGAGSPIKPGIESPKPWA